MTPTRLATPWDKMRDHWSAPTWLRTTHVVTGAPIALAAAGAILGLATLSVLFVWTVVVPLLALLVLLYCVPLFTRLQRARFAAFLGVEIPRLPRGPRNRNPVRWLVTMARTGSLWRQVVYHLLSPLISGVGVFAVFVAWVGGVVTAAVAVQGWVMRETWMIALFATLALGLFVVGPWAARGVAGLDVIAAEALLGPSRTDQLALRVEDLRESRAEVVDAADAERRRIERDLHDGVQQRLVSLAMNLGMARAALADLPEPAREVIAEAHEEAKQTLKELRDFVRGLHPAVLNDQGLDAALSGVAARSPIPVRLRVAVVRRASPTIEAVAFFVVSEALTNVAKHAGASAAEVMVWRANDRLHLAVTDDGCGGADPGGGTGLRGLAQRVGSVDGTLRIDSPAGGPTTIEAELPCE